MSDYRVELHNNDAGNVELLVQGGGAEGVERHKIILKDEAARFLSSNEVPHGRIWVDVELDRGGRISQQEIAIGHLRPPVPKRSKRPGVGISKRPKVPAGGDGGAGGSGSKTVYFAISRGDGFYEAGQWLSEGGWVKDRVWLDGRVQSERRSDGPGGPDGPGRPDDRGGLGGPERTDNQGGPDGSGGPGGSDGPGGSGGPGRSDNQGGLGGSGGTGGPENRRSRDLAKVLVVILSLLALVVAVGWLVYQVFSVFFAEDDVPSGVHEKTDSYVIYDNGTVFDKANEIQWTACLFGQEWTDGSCTGSAEEHTWENVENAADDANGASLAGHSDWRIPEADELRAFAEMGLGFNEGAVVWSATEQRGISGFAHAFELGQRGVQRISTGEERAVVLMRSPEVDDEGCEDCYR